MDKQISSNIFWMLFQPVFVFGSTFLAASAVVYDWMDSGTLVSILLLFPIPFYLILERFHPKRKDWLLSWSDLAEDVFWVSATYLIWLPIYDEHYSTPISDLFNSLRDQSGLSLNFDGYGMFGLVAVAILLMFLKEFISYWLHRMQHRFMFFWRIHATHHHITKMSVARTDRTHPLEFLGLTLGSAIVLGFFGASADVVGVYLVFGMSIAYSCHSNLPMTPGIFGFFFNTPMWHQQHHSCNYAESNTNFGCTVIIWDRVFGTFSSNTITAKIGNGTGDKLSLFTQLTLPFRSNKVIRKL
ncbi:MAG: sterol desaturase/sphingolipid hydroxylase (fatty acid hydroxylase superfamily) [Paraglaciecola sp.]|jgi:sterol desaturase/sphingolipid hydroxylase (fatty acid hydroxylase superfamily)